MTFRVSIFLEAIFFPLSVTVILPDWDIAHYTYKNLTEYPMTHAAEAI